MHVGILGGTGPLGRGLALRLAASGATVVIGSRHADRAATAAADLVALWAQRPLDISGAANPEAAGGDVTILATPWDSAVPTAHDLSNELAGKVVVCVANALVRQAGELHPLIGPRGSIAAAVQAALPEALVAAAGHHLPAATLADLEAPLEADVLVCADRAEAKAATMALFHGVAGLRPLDAGSLASASAIEAFTAVLVNLNIRYKVHSTLRLAGLDVIR
ncbi:MAG: NADPH-dependent F420 reductase [Acidimicrobiales bacterium]